MKVGASCLVLAEPGDGASQVVLVLKNLPASAGATGDTGLIPGWGRSPRERHSNTSSILTWRISWTEEPDRLQSTESHRVGHD